MELQYTDWTLVEPGVMILPTTKLRIVWDGKRSFILEWDGTSVGACGTLDGAKDFAGHHMRELTAMGIEP